MLNESFELAMNYLGPTFGVAFAYTWAKILLMNRINDMSYFHTRKEKIVSYLLGALYACGWALLIGFLTKSIVNGIAAFIVCLLAAVLAVLRLYGKSEQANKNTDSI